MNEEETSPATACPICHDPACTGNECEPPTDDHCENLSREQLEASSLKLLGVSPLEWFNPFHCLPDDEISCLVIQKYGDALPGYRDGDHWRADDGTLIHDVIAWALTPGWYDLEPLFSDTINDNP
jgi:hypothetical protein